MPYVKAAEWRRIQAILVSINTSAQNAKKTAALRAAIQADVKEYDLNDVLSFLYSRDEISRAIDPFGCASPVRYKDRSYFLISRPMFERILKETEVDTIQWIAEKSDCDDIAKYLSALMAVRFRLNSFGVVTSFNGGHAFNFALIYEMNGAEAHHHDDSDRVTSAIDIVYFEPQTDQIITQFTGPYELGAGKYATFVL